MSYSTSKILGRLAPAAQSGSVAPEASSTEADIIYDAPQLKLSATNVNEMQNALKNALGLSIANKHSPMD